METVVKIPLRRLLSKLTALALSASPIAATAAPQVDELEQDAPIDREHLAPRDAAVVLGRSLAQALFELPRLEATQLATTWALSEDALRRAAVGHALEWTFPLLGDDVIIDHLSRDADAAIRAASARAAWVRRTTGGDPGVLDRLVDDPDPDVRSIAVRARYG
jgi:hypothetical protein